MLQSIPLSVRPHQESAFRPLVALQLRVTKAETLQLRSDMAMLCIAGGLSSQRVDDIEPATPGEAELDIPAACPLLQATLDVLHRLLPPPHWFKPLLQDSRTENIPRPQQFCLFFPLGFYTPSRPDGGFRCVSPSDAEVDRGVPREFREQRAIKLVRPLSCAITTIGGLGSTNRLRLT